VSKFTSRSRAFRLLPGVVLVCGGLLVLKTTGLVHDAFAQETTSADAMVAAQKPVNADFAGSDSQMASAAEVDVLTSLSKRRAVLDAREAQIKTQANMLAATESRVDAKIAQLKDLQDQIAKLLVQRDDAQKAQILALVKTYSVMKVPAAAHIFNTLDDSVLVPVAQEMKSDVLAQILAAMNPDVAQKLTLKLANKLALPETMATPAVPGPQASATPAAATPAPGPAATPPAAKPAAAKPKA
jgi:flagellar motility protein MotE (MotC chaperone)